MNHDSHSVVGNDKRDGSRNVMDEASSFDAREAISSQAASWHRDERDQAEGSTSRTMSASDNSSQERRTAKSADDVLSTSRETWRPEIKNSGRLLTIQMKGSGTDRYHRGYLRRCVVGELGLLAGVGHRPIVVGLVQSVQLGFANHCSSSVFCAEDGNGLRPGSCESRPEELTGNPYMNHDSHSVVGNDKRDGSRNVMDEASSFDAREAISSQAASWHRDERDQAEGSETTNVSASDNRSHEYPAESTLDSDDIVRSVTERHSLRIKSLGLRQATVNTGKAMCAKLLVLLDFSARPQTA